MGRILAFARRRPAIALGLCVATYAVWPSQTNVDRPSVLQAAVLSDGFAAIDGPRHRIVELDGDGDARVEHAIDELPADTRVVGKSGSVGVIWKAGKRIAIAAVDDLPRRTLLGKSVHHVCEGTATDDRRFGVAWTEQDGTVWLLWGPASDRIDETTAADIAVPASLEPATGKQPAFCGIASGDDQVVLLWRDGKRTFVTRCRHDCQRYPTRAAIDPAREILGFGCTREACLVATRNDQHVIEVTWLDRKGKAVWTKPLPSACRDTTVTIVGAGAKIAIAYSLGPEPLVTLVDRAGTLKPSWQGGGDPDTVPGLAWSSHDGLLVAYHRDGAIATAILRP